METTVRYAFINPQMILDEDDSLIIRNLKLKDSGTYLCGEKNVNGSPTILKVGDEIEPVAPVLGQKDKELKEKQPINSLPEISNKDDGIGEPLDNEKAVPLIANEEDSDESSGSNTWLIILIILLAILVIAAFIFIVIYKERDSTTHSTPRFSPKKMGGESQYALKDCMEVDEDVTFIGTGQNLPEKQFDNQDKVEKEKPVSSPTTSSSASTLQANNIEGTIDDDNKKAPSKSEDNISPSRKTSNMSKSSSLFDCDCGVDENSSSHPCFK